MSSNEKYDDQIEAYLKGTLTPSEKKEFEEALADTPSLQTELQELKDYFASLTLIRKQRASSDFTDKVMSTIRAQKLPLWKKAFTLLPTFPKEAWGIALTALLVVGFLLPRYREFVPEESLPESALYVKIVDESQPLEEESVARPLLATEKGVSSPSGAGKMAGYDKEKAELRQVPVAQSSKSIESDLPKAKAVPPSPKPLVHEDYAEVQNLDDASVTYDMLKSEVATPVEHDDPMLSEKQTEEPSQASLQKEIVKSRRGHSKKERAAKMTVPNSSEAESYSFDNIEVEGYLDNSTPIYITDRDVSVDSTNRFEISAEGETPLSERSSLNVDKDEVSLNKYHKIVDTLRTVFPYTFTNACDTLEDGTYKVHIEKQVLKTFQDKVEELEGEIISEEEIVDSDSLLIHCRW